MALRKMQTLENAKGDKAAIYRDAAFGEYRVRFSMADIGYLPEADYHTNDLQDAIATAKHAIGLGE